MLFAIRVSSLVRCLSVSLAYFLNHIVLLLLLNFKGSLYILDNSPLVDVPFASIFFLSEAVFSFLRRCLFSSGFASRNALQPQNFHFLLFDNFHVRIVFSLMRHHPIFLWFLNYDFVLAYL